MNKLQLSLVLGFAMGIFVLFAYFKTAFTPLYEETRQRELQKSSYEYIWPDTIDRSDSIIIQ